MEKAKAMIKRRTVFGHALVGAVLCGTISLAVLVGVGQKAEARAQAAATLSAASVRTSETEAGNLVADAVRSLAGADAAFVPAAAFKPGATAPRPATAEQATGLLETASDEIVVLNLRGDQIMAALERSVSFAPQTSAGFLQVSGLRFTYDTRKTGGKRVSAATIAGTAIDASKVYKVATTKPLAHGQQGYFQIWEKDDIKISTGKTLANALTDYAKKSNNALSPALDGRIAQADK